MTITLNAPTLRCHSAMPQHRAGPHSASSIPITRGAKKRRRHVETGGQRLADLSRLDFYLAWPTQRDLFPWRGAGFVLLSKTIPAVRAVTATKGSNSEPRVGPFSAVL
jgi:hypothetical protein